MWPQARKRRRMPIVIDDPVLDALARTLAEQRGESIADVIRQALEAQMPVTEALQPEVPQYSPLRTREEKMAFMEDISRRLVVQLKEPMSSTDTGDLYDDWGLPK